MATSLLPQVLLLCFVMLLAAVAMVAKRRGKARQATMLSHVGVVLAVVGLVMALRGAYQEGRRDRTATGAPGAARATTQGDRR
jgi:predicted aspartyl protease